MKKQLAKYKLASAAILASVGAHADIIYTDVDPDESYNANGDEYQLDLNNDGTLDFTISNYSFSYGFPGFFSINRWGVDIAPESGNGIIASITTSYSSYYSTTNTNTTLLPLRVNDPISSGQTFVSSGGALVGSYSGSFFGQSFTFAAGEFRDTIFDRFIGLKFDVSGGTYYGWARVSAQVSLGSMGFTIFDYAYEDSGAPILAGAGVVSPGELNVSEDLGQIDVKIYAQDRQLFVKTEDVLDGEILVFSAEGKQVVSQPLNGRLNTINVADQPKGMYVVHVISGDKKSSQKIML